MQSISICVYIVQFMDRGIRYDQAKYLFSAITMSCSQVEGRIRTLYIHPHPRSEKVFTQSDWLPVNITFLLHFILYISLYFILVCPFYSMLAVRGCEVLRSFAGTTLQYAGLQGDVVVPRWCARLGVKSQFIFSCYLT